MDDAGGYQYNSATSMPFGDSRSTVRREKSTVLKYWGTVLIKLSKFVIVRKRSDDGILVKYEIATRFELATT